MTGLSWFSLCTHSVTPWYTYWPQTLRKDSSKGTNLNKQKYEIWMISVWWFGWHFSMTVVVLVLSKS